MKFCTNHENFEIKIDEIGLYDAWTKTHPKNWIKTPKTLKFLWFENFEKNDENVCMHVI